MTMPEYTFDFANAKAMALPMPLLDPVTIAIFILLPAILLLSLFDNIPCFSVISKCKCYSSFRDSIIRFLYTVGANYFIVRITILHETQDIILMDYNHPSYDLSRLSAACFSSS